MHQEESPLPITGPILVTGATGMQGGATVDALLDAGISVRALVRDPASAAARSLAERGVALQAGNFEDTVQLDKALEGAFGVFSVQLPPLPGDPDSEVRTGRNLVEAAKRAGVAHFVHTSVARAGDQANFAGWPEGRWTKEYWNSKSAVNSLVRAAGFDHWVVLKPAFMMENFIPPKAAWMFPLLASGFLGTAMTKGVPLDLVSAADVGRFAAAAFMNPPPFDKQDIDLAAEALDMDSVAARIASATGKPVRARYLTEVEAIDAGHHAGLVSSQQWASVEGYKVDLARAASFGVELETFAAWAQRHRNDFVVNV